MRRFLALVVVVLFAVSCAPAAPPPAEKPADPAAPEVRETLRLVSMELTPAPDPTLSYHTLAQEMGMFEEYGFDAEVRAAGGGGPAKVQALIAGEADVATSDIIAAMSAVFEATDVRVLFVPSARYGSPIFAQREYETLADAVGQQWGVASLGGSQRFYSILAARALGLDDDDFRWQAIGGSAEAVPALLNRRVEVSTITPIAGPLILKQEGSENVHVVVENTAEFTPPFPNFVLIARDEWVNNNPEAAERYVEMMLEMSREWAQNKSSWVDPSSRFFDQLDAEELGGVYDVLTRDGFWAVNGGINFEATQTVLDLFFEIRGDAPNEHLRTAEDVFNTEPLRRVLDRVGVVEGSLDEPDWYSR